MIERTAQKALLRLASQFPVIGITGPRQSGKSTLAKIIMGIEKPTSGKIFFNGEDITEKSISETLISL